MKKIAMMLVVAVCVLGCRSNSDVAPCVMPHYEQVVTPYPETPIDLGVMASDADSIVLPYAVTLRNERGKDAEPYHITKLCFVGDCEEHFSLYGGPYPSRIAPGDTLHINLKFTRGDLGPGAYMGFLVMETDMPAPYGSFVYPLSVLVRERGIDLK